MRRIAAPVGLLAAAVAMTLSSCALSSCALSGRADSPAASPSVPGVSSPAASASTVQVHAAVPAVFVAACGHPGAQVTVTALPVTIPRARCDLTGVVVIYGQTGVTVPAPGGAQANADATSGATDIGAFVDPSTGDVTLK